MKNNQKDIILTRSQRAAMDKIEDFIQGNDLNVFILKGYAGTGKTTLIRMLTKWLTETGISYSLHASTGRAAKVLSDATENPVTTVHSLLYTFSGLNQDLDKISHNGKAPIMDETGQLYLVFGMASLKRNNCDNTHVYIIDEASMLSDTKTEMPSQATFGSGQLMHDLFEYDAEAKFIFVGDDCQLPPISGGLSPALSCSYIEKVFSVQVAEATLSDIVRQKNSNDIPLAANGIRKMAMNPPDVYRWAKFHLKGFKNIIIHDSIAEMLDSYISNIKDKGYSYDSFLWIRDIWSPDTPWSNSVAEDKSDFVSRVGSYATDASRSGLSPELLEKAIGSYDVVMARIISSGETGVNGYMVLPILAVALNIVSQIIMRKQQKKSGQDVQLGQNKGCMTAMVVIMPLLMAYFAFIYCAAFTLYMVLNSVMSLLINLVTSGISRKMIPVDTVITKDGGEFVERYGRPDPNKTDKAKK